MISTQVTYPINLRPVSAPARTPGVHLSGVLRRVAQAANLLDYEEGEADLDTVINSTPPEKVGQHGQLMRIVMGFAWEDYIAKHIPGLVYHPGELFLDGVIATPDGMVMEITGPVIHEFKWTFKSTKTAFTSQQLYLWQLGCYLKMLGATIGVPCLTGVLHICHVRGDYKGIDPQYIATKVEFAPAEIEGYWNMVQRNKHLAVPEKGQGQ